MQKISMKRTVGFAALMALGLGAFGCSATQIRPEANRVIVTHQAAPKGCKFLGSVVGEQGGSLTGGWTSNKNLQQGALNDMKNKAYDLGGNYVVLENTNAGNTTSGGFGSSGGSFSGQQTDVTHMGNAYKCAEGDIGAK